MTVVFAEVLEGRIIAAVKAFPVSVPVLWRNGRTPVFPPVLHIRVMAILKVVAGGFNTVVKALTLNVAELLRWRIPAAAIVISVLPVLVLWWRTVLRQKHGRGSQCKSKRWKSKSVQIHGWIPPCISCTLAEMVEPYRLLHGGVRFLSRNG